MKRRPDEIDPVGFPQLFYLLWCKADIITPEEALETYTNHWHYVNYEMMSNDERMLLIKLIDELSNGIFEPFFDDLGQDRRPVVVELKMITYDEMMEERAKFIGPPQPPHPPKTQPKMKSEEVDQKSQNDTMSFTLSKLTRSRRQ